MYKTLLFFFGYGGSRSILLATTVIYNHTSQKNQGSLKKNPPYPKPTNSTQETKDPKYAISGKAEVIEARLTQSLQAGPKVAQPVPWLATSIDCPLSLDIVLDPLSDFQVS